MVWSAPSARTRTSLGSDEEVAITVAPMALAICNAKIDTPPVPSTRMLSPALRPASATRPRRAVQPQGEEARHDRVADLELGDTLAHGLDHACAVRQRDAALELGVT